MKRCCDCLLCRVKGRTIRCWMDMWKGYDGKSITYTIFDGGGQGEPVEIEKSSVFRDTFKFNKVAERCPFYLLDDGRRLSTSKRLIYQTLLKEILTESAKALDKL